MRKSHFKALYALKAANKKAKSRRRPHGRRMRASWFSELAKRKFVLPRGRNSKILEIWGLEILKFKEFWNYKFLNFKNFEIS